MAQPDDTLESLLASQRVDFDAHPYQSWPTRKAALQRLSKTLHAHEQDFIAAISDDFGNRSSEETLVAELLIVQGAIGHALRHTQEWMATRRTAISPAFWPAKNKVVPQPLGVVGIISPWNYPVQLSIGPLIGALAAGNRVMLKPSELTPKTSALLKSVLEDAFAPEQVKVVTGGADIAAAFSSLPFDHLIFTGSTKIGRLVAAAAAKNLTPCTLELGGKSPVIIDPSADLNTAVTRITLAKLLNAGQTCVAPDYLMMPADKINDFTQKLLSKAEQLYPSVAGNPDYSSIVSEAHYKRLTGLLNDAKAKGAQIETVSAQPQAELAAARKIPLTVLTNLTDDMKIMTEEIFGPLLPILPAKNTQAALNYVSQKERPLALYWFGKNSATQHAVLTHSHSGGVCVNDCMLHVVQDCLPFGGIGASGIGAYHGRHGFESLSHMKGVFVQSRFAQTARIAPPYTAKTRKFIALFRKLL